MIKLILRTVLVLVALILCATAYIAIAYRGFATDFANDIVNTSWPEIKAKYAFYYYYARYYEQLRLNPKTNMYDLEDAAQKAHESTSATDFDRALLDFHRGRFMESVREIEADIKQRGESGDKLFWLGMSYIRVAETENCLVQEAANMPASMPGHDMVAGTHMTSPLSCSLPLQTYHQKKEWSEKAGATFERLLDQYDKGNPLDRWLLNFTYMTINRFPEGVPARYRIDTPFINAFYGKGKEAAAAAHPDLLLEDQAKELGVNTFDAGKGVAVEDFNGDGWLDIVTGGTFSGTRYYENDHGTRFIDRTAGSGLAELTQAYMITAADYDNDGRMDLMVSRPFQRFHLMHNDGGGKFSDTTFTSGLLPGEPPADLAVYTCVTAWDDVNKDGKLDLFVAQFGQKLPFVGGLLGRKPMSSKLYINQGGGKFTDGTEEYGLSGVVDDSIFIGATFGDYDGDGWPDLYLSSVSSKRSVLLRNIGGKKFEPTTLIDSRQPSFTTSFIDIDHDGHLDLFRGAQSLAVGSTNNAVFGKNPTRFASTIYLQRNGSFENRPDLFGGAMPIGTMGASFGDINNDGCYDFYLGTGSPESWFVLPNLMYLGESSGTTCTGKMENISMLFGVGTIQKGHAIVFFDYNNDGLQDVYASLGGMWPGDEWPNQFWVNKSTTKNSWVKIRLRGTETNYFGVGASMRVTAVNASGAEIVRTYNMTSKSGFGSAPYLAHIGLMDATEIRAVDVRWPVSGKVKHYTAKLNELTELREDAGVQ